MFWLGFSGLLVPMFFWLDLGASVLLTLGLCLVVPVDDGRGYCVFCVVVICGYFVFCWVWAIAWFWLFLVCLRRYGLV